MPYAQLTLADLLDELEQLWEGTPFWTDSEAITSLNHALRLWNLLTGFWKKRILLATVTGHYQDLPGSLTFGMQLTYGPTGLPIHISALVDLDFARPRWEEEFTTSGGDVPAVSILWAPVGIRALALWPAPPAGTDILVDGVAATPVLVNPSDHLDMGEQDASSVVRMALHIASFKRGLGAIRATTIGYQDFLKSARQQNARLMHSLFFRKALGLDMEKALRPIISEGRAVTGEAPEKA